MKKRSFVLLLTCCLLPTCLLARFDPRDYEEDGGGGFTLLANPDDETYGMRFGFGVWLKNTPIFGDTGVSLVRNNVEDALYSGLDLTLRVMPHWTVAPFAGGGASYNYSLSGESDKIDPGSEGPEALDSRGEDYWGTHVESGIRIWTGRSRISLFELLGRYTWSSLDGDRDYWLAGVMIGAAY